MKKKILFVDDLLHVRTFMTRALGDYDVKTAASGAEALELLKEESFELLITDWNMAGMDGLELVRQARILYPALPAIMATAKLEELLHDHGPEVAAGRIRTLDKPFSVLLLIDLVNQTIATNSDS